jgi:hypothetical protein
VVTTAGGGDDGGGGGGVVVVLYAPPPLGGGGGGDPEDVRVLPLTRQPDNISAARPARRELLRMRSILEHADERH